MILRIFDFPGLEFSFSQSPKYLQAFVTGAYLLYNGLGSLFGSLLVTIVNAASAGGYGIVKYTFDI